MDNLSKFFFIALLILAGIVNKVSAQETDSIAIRISSINAKSRFIDKEGKAHLYSTEHYPNFMKYQVTEKKPVLHETGNNDSDFNQYRNELQHWYFLYDKKGYVEKFGTLPDLTGKKPIEGSTLIFDAATAPKEYRNKKSDQK